MTAPFPVLPDQIPKRDSIFSRNMFKRLYLAQGWRFDGEFPDLPKAVAIISPHTSNYDAYYAFMALLGLDIKVTVFAKRSLFKNPLLKNLLHWIGVIPVDRDAKNGLTQEIIDQINQEDRIWIAMAPEGTRKRAEKIRTGFYRIATGANIPIVMFAIDYDNKAIHCLGMMQPTGDYEADLKQIFNTYRGKFSPKFPENLALPLREYLD